MLLTVSLFAALVVLSHLYPGLATASAVRRAGYLDAARVSPGGLISRRGKSFPGYLGAGDPYVDDVVNATAFAAVYGYPLLPWFRFQYQVVHPLGPNVIYSLQNVQTATIDYGVRPNADTVYSEIPIDLSRYDVSITIPEVDDGRFYVFPFYDVWGNNFANLGSLNNTEPGKYLVRNAVDGHQRGVELESDPSSEYKGYINSPSPWLGCLVRVLLFNQSDVENVQAINRQILVKEVIRTSTAFRDCPTTKELINITALTTLAVPPFPGYMPANVTNTLLHFLARVVPWSPPENASLANSIAQTLEVAGIKNGVYTPPTFLNYTSVNTVINETLSWALSDPSSYTYYANGWNINTPSLSGDFGSNWAVRTFIAWQGYQELDLYEAMYPEYTGSSGYDLSGQSAHIISQILAKTLGSLTVASNSSYLFTFPSKPPVKGFWSLTAYGANQSLIPNDLNVFSLGDRSNLTYADGARVYGVGAKDTDDESFQLLVQPADVKPPMNWTGNWLPAPAGGGSISVNLRYYGPTEEILNGSWVQPLVTMQDAIVA